jgi:hypothetical protein
VEWDSLDLDTAAFLFGYLGCLGGNEIVGLLPAALEILLRSRTYVRVFNYFLFEFKWNGSANLRHVFGDREGKATIETAFLTLRDKFLSAASEIDGYKMEELFSDVSEWFEVSNRG